MLAKRIDQLAEHIRVLAEQHPNHSLVASLPGAGQALEPRLAVALGTNPLACASGPGSSRAQRGGAGASAKWQ